MGSLMSGWSCQVHDPKKVKYMRNRSMTRDEIDAYWKTKKESEDDHHHETTTIKSISSPLSSSSSFSLPTTPSITSGSNYTLLTDHDDDEYIIVNESVSESNKGFRRSSSMPVQQISSKQLISPEVTSKKSNSWWMESKWAFLNEPPVLINESTQKPKRMPYNCAKHADFMSQREATFGL